MLRLLCWDGSAIIAQTCWANAVLRCLKTNTVGQADVEPPHLSGGMEALQAQTIGVHFTVQQPKCSGVTHAGSFQRLFLLCHSASHCGLTQFWSHQCSYNMSQIESIYWMKLHWYLWEGWHTSQLATQKRLSCHSHFLTAATSIFSHSSALHQIRLCPFLMFRFLHFFVKSHT